MDNIPETKAENRLRTAGALLLIFGIGIPVVSVIVSVLYIATSRDVFARLILLATGPVAVIPLWALQIIGGIFALQNKHYTFVLVSASIALLYWIPFLIFVIASGSLMFTTGDAFFWLYLPVLALLIPAFIDIVRSKR